MLEKVTNECSLEDLFKFICEKSKLFINSFVKKKLREQKNQIDNRRDTNDSILQTPIGVIFRKNPGVLDFENKKTFF